MSGGWEREDLPGMEMSERLRRGIGHLQAVMFDLDGTLIDSIPTYFRIISAMLEHVGLPPAPREAMSAALKNGLAGFEHLVPEEMGHRREELVDTLLRVGKRISEQLYPGSVGLIAGVEDLFRRLAGKGIAIGIVSSSHREYVGRKLLPLKEAGIDALVDAIVVIEDTEEMKPSSEPVLACLERLGARAERSLFVGDADVDVLAGKRAGTFTAGVLTGVDDHGSLSAEEPDVILPGVQDLIPLF